jgi:hypothetical protein
MKRSIPPIVLALAGLILVVVSPAIGANPPEPEKVTPIPVLFVDPTCEAPEGHPVFPEPQDDRYTYGQSDIVTNADDVVVSSTWTAVVNDEFIGVIELVGDTSWSHTYPEPNCSSGDDKAGPPSKPGETLPNTGA